MRSAFAISALLVGAAAAGADATKPTRLGADGKAFFERQVSLDTISPAELRLETPTLNMGKFGNMPTKGATRPIVREMPDFWQLTVDDVETLKELDVTYVVESVDGVVNALTHRDSEDSVLRVRVEATGFATQKARDADQYVVSGGVRLFLYLDDVRHAGAYQGTLRAVVERR